MNTEKHCESASLIDIINYTKSDMDKVNAIILDMAKSQTELIPQIASYLANAGGKRIRPMLTLASASLFGYQKQAFGRQDNVKLATAVEFMHTATLLHDDVVDESDLRRGKQAVRKIWGNQASVLVGDFLLGQAFRLMVETGSLAALDVLAKAASVIAEGEVMQLSAAQSLTTSKADYFEIINAKTAELFAAAVGVGAIIANRSKEDLVKITEYGQKLGIAFQLVDDILDYGGASVSLGKNTGDDFREGKITLPVLLCYENCNQQERDFWEDALVNRNNSDEQFAVAFDMLKKYDSLTKASNLAKEYGEEAKKALISLDEVDEDVRGILLDVVDFSICRVK